MSRFEVAYLGNVNNCRTEAEIMDSLAASGSDPTCAIVHDSGGGMKVEYLPQGQELQADPAFSEALNNAWNGLLRYVNRCGDNPPPGLTAAGLSLWLMEKSDGTAMGTKFR